ncbi:MAG: hypothetical protein ACQESD_01270 [Thermoplasmatota archaeon]
MVKMSQEKILKKSKSVCENVALKIKESEEAPSPLEVKMMIEDELDFGLSKEEITLLAITFKHIDNLFSQYDSNSKEGSKMMYL